MKRWITISILFVLSLFLFFIYYSTSVDLHEVTEELNSTRTELYSTRTELRSTQEELHSTQTELASTWGNLSTTQNDLAERENELTDLQISYDGLMASHGYTIKDPTYNEMIRFLRADDTDKAEYIEGEYECTEFAVNLCNRAEDKLEREVKQGGSR